MRSNHWGHKSKHLADQLSIVRSKEEKKKEEGTARHPRLHRSSPLELPADPCSVRRKLKKKERGERTEFYAALTPVSGRGRKDCKGGERERKKPPAIRTVSPALLPAEASGEEERKRKKGK